MPTYRIRVTQTREWVVEIKADDGDKALAEAEERYGNDNLGGYQDLAHEAEVVAVLGEGNDLKPTPTGVTTMTKEVADNLVRAANSVPKLKAERDDLLALARWMKAEIFEHRENIPAPGKYLSRIDALLATLDGGSK